MSRLPRTEAGIYPAEVLTGTVETEGSSFKIHFASKMIMNDPRMVSSARRFELDGDTLRYEMEMQTTKVDEPTHHLKMSLERVKQ